MCLLVGVQQQNLTALVIVVTLHTPVLCDAEGPPMACLAALVRRSHSDDVLSLMIATLALTALSPLLPLPSF